MDKVGRPIYVDCLGKTDIKKALTMATEEQFFNEFIQSFEDKCKRVYLACSHRSMKQITKTTLILDMKGFSMSNWNSDS